MHSPQDPTDTLQQQLAAEYQALTILYGDATKVAVAVRDDFLAGSDGTSQTHELRKLMDTIQRAEEKARPLREQWDRVAGTANAELKQAVERLASAITEMIGPINEAETMALAARDRKQPVRGPAINTKNMVAAYGAARLDTR